VLSEIFFLNETKNHNTPLQVKWSVPYHDMVDDDNLIIESLVQNQEYAPVTRILLMTGSTVMPLLFVD
jgi:hypothetical protein